MDDKGRDARWWEYYAVRYALGVGVGSPIVFALARGYASGTTISGQVHGPFGGTIAALLWAAAGTAFCYIASVPVLVLHASRGLFLERRWYLWFFFIAAIVLAIGLSVVIWQRLSIQAEWVGYVALFFTVAGQFFHVGKLIWDRASASDFYSRLARQRARDDHAEYIESYRHLREHGNSIAIVVWEVILAFILWSTRLRAAGLTPNLEHIGLVGLIWLLPASLVWFIGSYLESRLAEGGLEIEVRSSEASKG